jgi:hypothetical protein
MNKPELASATTAVGDKAELGFTSAMFERLSLGAAESSE